MSGTNDVDLIVMVQADRLERWDLFRAEMENHKERLSKLALSFLDLGCFDDAAKCAINAEGIKYVLGRMPKQTHKGEGSMKYEILDFLKSSRVIGFELEDSNRVLRIQDNDNDSVLLSKPQVKLLIEELTHLYGQMNEL